MASVAGQDELRSCASGRSSSAAVRASACRVAIASAIAPRDREPGGDRGQPARPPTPRRARKRIGAGRAMAPHRRAAPPSRSTPMRPSEPSASSPTWIPTAHAAGRRERRGRSVPRSIVRPTPERGSCRPSSESPVVARCTTRAVRGEAHDSTSPRSSPACRRRSRRAQYSTRAPSPTSNGSPKRQSARSGPRGPSAAYSCGASRLADSGRRRRRRRRQCSAAPRRTRRAAGSCSPPTPSTQARAAASVVGAQYVGLVPGLEPLAQVAEEAAGERAVDQPVVVRQRQVHDRPDRDHVLAELVLDDPRPLDDARTCRGSPPAAG